MARTLTVTYDNGTVEKFKLGPKALLAAEDVLGEEARTRPMRSTFIAAWKASKSDLEFDAWLDTVDDVEEADEATSVDPTTETPSTDELPPS